MAMKFKKALGCAKPARCESPGRLPIEGHEEVAHHEEGSGGADAPLAVEDHFAELWGDVAPPRASTGCIHIGSGASAAAADDDAAPPANIAAEGAAPAPQEAGAAEAPPGGAAAAAADAAAAAEAPASGAGAADEPVAPPAPSMGVQTLACADAVPDPQADNFLKDTPAFKRDMPGVSMATIRRCLEEEPFIMQKCFELDIKAYDIKPSKWQPSAHSPGTLIRCMKFKMPLPDDVPGAAKSMITLPDFCTCQSLCRLRVAASELDLTYQTIVDGMPFADYFRLQVTDSFTPFGDASDGGITFRRWVVIVWVKELPWMMRPARSFVASKTMAGAADAAKILVDLFTEEGAKAESAG